MAEAQQFAFDLKEVTKLLIRDSGVKEGTWFVGFEFGFMGGNLGPTSEELKPGGLMLINRLILVRHADSGSPPAFAMRAEDVAAER